MYGDVFGGLRPAKLEPAAAPGALGFAFAALMVVAC